MDFALKTTRLLRGGTLRPGTVVVRDGRVVDETAVGLPTEDLGDLVLMAGVVDSHVHVNEPGRTEWEGFDTATKAAAVGGITTIVDMPLNCIPVTTTAKALRRKLEAAGPKLWVDAGFWGGVVPGNAADLPDLARAGVLGAKAFLCHSGIDDFPNCRRDDLLAAMPALREAGIPLLVHAELVPDDVVETATDPTSYEAWLHSRPPEWEDAAIAMAIDLCRATGCAVHIVHLSASMALPRIRQAKAEGLPVTVETCPHYLILTAEEVMPRDTRFKCAPPIREAANRDALWAGLADGTIDFVVSDHSPCTPHLKVPDRGDFIDAWGGISSLQFGLSSVWTEARSRGHSVLDVNRWMCRGPAALAGLARKGHLGLGADADLVAWDPDAEFVVDPEIIHHRHKVSPWVGRRMSGQVRHTWVRGHRVVRDGMLAGEPVGRPLIRRTKRKHEYQGSN
jgi:allantoinase